MGRRIRRWVLGVLRALAVAYPLSLLGVCILFSYVGERWWVTGIALYLPRVGFALPLLLLVPGLALARLFRLLALQLVSLWLLLFPLMGLTLSFPSAPGPGQPALRVLSYNVNSANGGMRETLAEVTAFAPDVACLVELPDSRFEEARQALLPKYPHIWTQGEFLVASRLPISSHETPPRIPYFGKLRSPRFMKLVVETPLGPVAFFLVHTVSPRGGFYELRGHGLRREIASGRLLRGDNAESFQSHSALRGLQMQEMSELAQRETLPVVILGDTNLPVGSRTRRLYLGGFQDGFDQAGSGFGATFPSKWPWMRIDLVLASDALRFTDFRVGQGRASDHRCVVADLVKVK